MRSNGQKWLVVLFVCLALSVTLAAATATAQEKTEVSGTMSASYTQQDTIAVGDQAGHLLTLVMSEGTNTETSKAGFMVGATIRNMSQSDVVNGNGSQQGYLSLMKDGEMVFASWKGKLTTTMVEGKPPVTSFGGTFTYTMGTGKYENIKGGGSYEGKFTSETEYKVDWKGEYTIEK